MFIEALQADSGLCAFGRVAEREHQMLINIAKYPEAMLTVAYNDDNKIVGELTLAPGDDWWHFPGRQVHIYEIGIDVSYFWRRRGIARQLLTLALDLDTLEDMIVVGMGLSWHWDTERTGIPPMRYRQLIAHVLAPYGFSEYLTIEPNIASEPANILLVRIGRNVSAENVNLFMNRLLGVDTLL